MPLPPEGLRSQSLARRPSRRRSVSPGTRREPRDTASGSRPGWGGGPRRAPLAGPPGRASSWCREPPGAAGGAPQGWRDRPRHLRPLPARPPPAGRRLPWRRINTIPRDGAPREPPARRGPHPPPMGNPVPPPPAATARPPPRSDVSPDGLSCPGGARPPPSVTAVGHRPGTRTRAVCRPRRGRAPWGPPCAVPAATSAPPVQAKLHPFKLSPL